VGARVEPPDAAVVARLAAAYGLGPTPGFRYITDGQSFASYVLTAESEDYVLSLSDGHGDTDIGYLVAMLRHLEAHGFPTSRMVPTRDGAYALDLGGRTAIVKTYIAGRTMARAVPALASALGRELAALHAIPVPDGSARRHAYGIECFGELAEATGHETFAGWLAAKTDWIGAALSPRLPRGFIHSDAFPDNVLVSGNRLRAIIDFEHACDYYLAFDLGMAIAGMARLPGFATRHAEALVAGYEERRALSGEERAALPAFVVYAATATAFWRYRQYEVRKRSSPQQRSWKEIAAVADGVQRKGLAFFG